MDIDQVADELYRLDPAKFTATRDLRAAEARRGRDRTLATTIKKLRRPSTAAWAVNLLACERPDELEELVQIGARLRQAQAVLSGDDVRALGRQRQQAITGLVRAADDLARHRQQPIGEANHREIRATLEAAAADPDAGSAVRSGRLVRALEYSGFGPVDLVDTVGGPALSLVVDTDQDPTPPRPARAKKGLGREESGQGRARLATADKEYQQAEAARQRAEAQLLEAEQRLAAAEADVSRLEEETAFARRAADAARADHELAGRLLDVARSQEDQARRARYGSS